MPSSLFLTAAVLYCALYRAQAADSTATFEEMELLNQSTEVQLISRLREEMSEELVAAENAHQIQLTKAIAKAKDSAMIASATAVEDVARLRTELELVKSEKSRLASRLTAEKYAAEAAETAALERAAEAALAAAASISFQSDAITTDITGRQNSDSSTDMTTASTESISRNRKKQASFDDTSSAQGTPICEMTTEDVIDWLRQSELHSLLAAGWMMHHIDGAVLAMMGPVELFNLLHHRLGVDDPSLVRALQRKIRRLKRSGFVRSSNKSKQALPIQSRSQQKQFVDEALTNQHRTISGAAAVLLALDKRRSAVHNNTESAFSRTARHQAMSTSASVSTPASHTMAARPLHSASQRAASPDHTSSTADRRNETTVQSSTASANSQLRTSKQQERDLEEMVEMEQQ
eukprot:SAG31_NODE_3345_length_4377_cov_3.568256_1_plen_405_part_10